MIRLRTMTVQRHMSFSALSKRNNPLLQKAEACGVKVLKLHNCDMARTWTTFDGFFRSGKIFVCEDKWVHSRLSIEYDNAIGTASPCLFRLRSERNATVYIWRLWNELFEANRRDLTRIVTEKVYSLLERLTVAIGQADKQNLASQTNLTLISS